MQVGGPGNPFTPDDEWLHAIAQDAKGAVWVGTDEHVYRYEGERWQTYTEQDGAPEWTIIWDIQADGDVIWFATSYSGLYRLDSIGWLRLGAEGTGSVFIRGLYRTSDGALWILTTDGITRLVGDPYAE
jgi:ligand-binding sensor domain-containing protein